MTNEKLKAVLKFYSDYASKWAQDASHRHEKDGSLHDGEVLDKVKEMAPKAMAFVDEGRVDKAHRWLGFIQGILSPWSRQPYFTLDDLMNHSRPKGEEKDAQV